MKIKEIFNPPYFMCRFFSFQLQLNLNKKMSIEDGQPYYSDNQEDYLPLYYYMCYSEEEDLSFPEEYHKNISDCQNSQNKNTKFNVFPTSNNLESSKSLQSMKAAKKQKQNLSERQDVEERSQSTSPQMKDEVKISKQVIGKPQKCKRIVKKKYAKKTEIVLNLQQRLLQSRQIKLQRYRQKKLKRNWQRGILYAERKKLACRRQRIQGRFQGKPEQIESMVDQENCQKIAFS